jgi:hypothetical protein
MVSAVAQFFPKIAAMETFARNRLKKIFHDHLPIRGFIENLHITNTELPKTATREY